MSTDFNEPKGGLISNTPEWEALKQHVEVIQQTHLRARVLATSSARVLHYF